MIVQDILGKEWNCKCIGCSIGNDEITPPGEIIMSTENFVLHQDPEIPIKGFLIIASKNILNHFQNSLARNHKNYLAWFIEQE